MKYRIHYGLSLLLLTAVFIGCREIDTVLVPLIELEQRSYSVAVGEELLLDPVVYHTDEHTAYSWWVNDKEAGNERRLIFNVDRPGVYLLRFQAASEHGMAQVEVQVEVTALELPEPPEVPLTVSFDYPRQSASLGRTVRVAPVVSCGRGVTYRWFVDGVEDNRQTTALFVYTPGAPGDTEIRVVVSRGSSSAEASLILQTVQPEQYERQITDTSSPFAEKVFAYLPAPGQFINSRVTLSSPEEATRYAEGRLADGSKHVSLGAFGGYIVVGFDHSIKNSGSWDFAILGNAFKGSSEPGIVWVMQDENGNGLPDDNWYELRGSETGKPETIQDYEVTYYRPPAPKMHTLWVDGFGTKGEVPWLGFHPQDYYYPGWVKGEAYTLRGTRLGAQTEDESVWVTDG